RPAKFNLSDGGIVTGAAFGPLTGQVTILLRNGFALIKDTTTNSVLWTNSSGSTHDAGQGIGTRLMSAGSRRMLIVLIDEGGNGAQIWNVQTNDHWPLQTQKASRFKMAEISSDMTRVISVSEGGKAQLWNAETGEELFPLDDTGVTSAHFSSDGSSVVTASLNRTIRVWDPKTGRLTRQLLGHGGGVDGARVRCPGSRNRHRAGRPY